MHSCFRHTDKGMYEGTSLLDKEQKYLQYFLNSVPVFPFYVGRIFGQVFNVIFVMYSVTVWWFLLVVKHYFEVYHSGAACLRSWQYMCLITGWFFFNTLTKALCQNTFVKQHFSRKSVSVNNYFLHFPINAIMWWLNRAVNIFHGISHQLNLCLSPTYLS